MDFLKIEKRTRSLFLSYLYYFFLFLSIFFIAISTVIFFLQLFFKHRRQVFQLNSSLNEWKKHGIYQKLQNFELNFEIKQSSFSLTFSKKPLIDLAYIQAYFFFDNSKLSNYRLNLYFGILPFRKLNFPLKKFNEICLIFKYINTKLKDKIFKNIENLPKCNNKENLNGISIFSFKDFQTNFQFINCLGLKNYKNCLKICNNQEGFLLKDKNQFICRKYKVLSKICIKVNILGKNLKFSGGCFKNNEISQFIQAKRNYVYKMDNISIEIHEENDPFILFLDFTMNMQKKFKFNFRHLNELSYFLYSIGFFIFLLLILIYLHLKANSFKIFSFENESVLEFNGLKNS